MAGFPTIKPAFTVRVSEIPSYPLLLAIEDRHGIAKNRINSPS